MGYLDQLAFCQLCLYQLALIPSADGLPERPPSEPSA